MTSVSFDAGAGAYDRVMSRWSRLDIPALLAAAEVTAGQTVLDVATGTGELALMAAALVSPTGKVVACDISLPMLRMASMKIGGRPITLAAMDAQALPCQDGSFDAVICRLGLMFFADPKRGLGEFRRVLRPRGRLAVFVLATTERVPLLGLAFEALAPHLPGEQKTLRVGFSLGDTDLLSGLLTEAGFRDVRVTRDRREIVFDSFDDYWSPFEAGGGRAGQLYQGLPEHARGAVRQEIRERITRFESDGRLVVPAESLFGIARSASP